MLKLVCLFAVVAIAMADPWDGVPVASAYINLGATDNQPATFNCTTYAALFTPTGILHAPGIPDCIGTAQIKACCEADHQVMNPLISYLDNVIAVQSWDTTKRLAFSWMINGQRAKDGTNSNTPAISSFFMTADALITEGFSFYDDQILSGTNNAPPFNPDKVIFSYMNNGASDPTKAPVWDCANWAALFEKNGVSNEPGIPPFNGTSALTKACANRAARFKILVPVVDLVFPVESWDATKRVAFQWTQTGVDSNGQAYVVPSITVLYMDKYQNIVSSWDWWNTDLLPPTAQETVTMNLKL